VTLEVSYEPVRDQNDVTGVVGVAHDISLRKRLEEQFLQSQNMEAVGQLAGGIAHDFNNILSAILGYAQLGLTSLPSGSHLDGYLTEIQKSAERAAILTRQLLTFSRRQIIQPEVFDPSELILNMHSMLRRLIGEDIDLVVRPDPDAGRVEMDKGQMEQVLVNLAINARDAMPNGGRLLIETANVTLENQYVELNGETTLENYVMLLVSDSGMGMTEEVKAHIFEPFFTTKGPGKGTGLGYRLATASWPRAEVASPLTASGGGGPR
jgi:signal transduction histidine kinase